MKLNKLRYILPIGICAILLIAYLIYSFFAPLSATGNDEVLYVDSDDNVDSVFCKIDSLCNSIPASALKTLLRHSDYSSEVHTGRYKISTSDCVFTTFRRILKGRQTSSLVVIPCVRTKEQIAKQLDEVLMMDSTEVLNIMNSDSLCKKYGFDIYTIMCIFIPDSYDLYWNISVDDFFKRMKKEYDTFWTKDRKVLADSMHLTPEQVMTIASIVEEETNNENEKPIVAGLYYNRYVRGIKLQADPTIRFSLNDFTIKRVLNNMLNIESPYNTYKYAGLPPGPIRIPSKKGIDAVLNYTHHDYIFMCAKEDFSGTHNFAVTAAEHMQNASHYTKALNERGIK